MKILLSIFSIIIYYFLCVMNINDRYCIMYDKLNDMEINMKKIGDTVFISYLNVVENGKYINGSIDKNDFAGYFLYSELKNAEIDINIKNYYLQNVYYKVNLKFSSDSNIFFWEIKDKGPVVYLPKMAKFTECVK